MLDPQKSELPHETEYFLDGAVECLDLDAGTRVVLIVFGDRQRIQDIVEPRIPWSPGRVGADAPLDKVDTKARFSRFKAKRIAKCDQLTAHADELLTQLGPIYRLGAHITAVNNLLTSLRAHASCYADWAMTDANEGGAMEDYDRRKLSWHQHERRDKESTKRVSRKLHAPAWIKDYVERKPESYQMRAIWHTLARRGVPKYNESQLDAALGVFDAAYERHRERVAAAQQRAYDAFVADVTRAKAPKKPPYRIVKQERKVAKRAAIFAAGLLGASTVSAFAAGQPVHIEGSNMVFEVKKRGTIHRVGHGSLDFAVLDKDRTKLADLCFFIEGTPAIDQLTGLALAVRAGEETEILDTANVIKVAPAGVGHELLGARSVQAEPQIIPRAEWRNGVIMPVGHVPHDARRARNNAYFAETKDIWIETLGKHVFNREWKNVKGMMAA